MSKELTPLMKQYWEIKAFHKDKILMFRMGDFFEMFYDDATTAAPILGITLTQRNKKSEDNTPMCGMPHHSVAGPINKLLSAGHKVALCDQIEDPKLAKGIVKRAVTRILTPGMVYDSDQIKATESHFICSQDQDSISFIDTTTGESFYFTELSVIERKQIFTILPIAEIVVSSEFEQAEFLNVPVTKTIFEFKINNLSKEQDHLPMSAQRLLAYVDSLIINRTDNKIISTLQAFEKRTLKGRLNLNFNTIKHLEIFTNYKGEEKGSLFFAINRTLTSPGARRLRDWIRFPLVNVEDILQRHYYINYFRDHLFELKQTRETFPKMGDIERRLSKIGLPQRHGRDLTSLAVSIQAGLSAIKISNQKINFSKYINSKLLQALSETILNTIVEEAPLSNKQGHIIKKGVSPELDEIIHIAENAQVLISDLESKERQLTGISSLKIRYNNVFGFYIEITNAHKDKAPARYQRKQTLTNAERYCTDELVDIERKVLTAQTRRNELEFVLFENLCEQILKMSQDLILLAKTCSELDIYSSLAWLSLEENYSKPNFSNNGTLNIIESRHPVVEQFQRDQNKLSRFVANNINLNKSDCYLITGPNMAGKSTLMRQIALTSIMAQVGCFVPATNATLPVYDSIFTRIGASDQLTEGLSTFMVEMTETAEMLHRSNHNSLLILDEVGRGTSTFDGLCLAQSILEYILKNIKAHVLFATHYHELVSLDKKYSEIKNVHMKIDDQFEKKSDTIKFLYLLRPGSAGKSYGVQVAELAGLPPEIISNAKKLLQKYENENSVKIKSDQPLDQLSLFKSE